MTTTSTLKTTIHQAFTALLKTSTRGMVRIHELRAQVEASREDFDRALRQLGRDRVLRLIPISDYSLSTPSQLADGIPNLGQVYFYAEER